MKVYDKIGLPGSWSINNRIAGMLEECGSYCDTNPCSSVNNGDLNNDAIANITDIITLVSYILYGNELDCIPDVNQDGSVNVNDVVTLVNIILG